LECSKIINQVVQNSGTYTASLVNERNGIVVLKREDGFKVEVFEKNLSEDDQHYLQGIKKKVTNKLVAADGK